MSEEIVVHEPHRNAIAKLSTNPFGEAVNMRASFPIDTPEGRALASKCMGKSDFSGEEAMGQTWDVAHVFCHQVELADAETGQVADAVRTVLVDPAGATLAFCSQGVFKSLAQLAALRGGPPPWDPPLRIKIVQQRTRKKFLVYTLQMTPDQPEGK